MHNDKDMIDLGRKYDETAPELPQKNEKSYPSLYLSGVKEDLGLPDGEFYAVIRAKKTSSTCSENETGQKTYSCDLQVMGIKLQDESDDDDDGSPGSAAKAIMKSLGNARAGKY